MNGITVRPIDPAEIQEIRELDRDAFAYNERGSDGAFHEVFADNIRRSPYFIPQLDLVAVAQDGVTCLGHAIFSMLPMGDAGEHVVWLNSLAVRHAEQDDHAAKSYRYQRKGIGTALVAQGLDIARSLGYTGCMTCGHPDVYQRKMGFLDCRDLGIEKDDSVDEPYGALFAKELVPGGFDRTGKRLSFAYHDFSRVEDRNVDAALLSNVLAKLLGKSIVRASWQTETLHGGTLGDVRLVMGIALAADGERPPYKVVWKTQKKWERQGDPGSWRREYDLYTSALGAEFGDSLRWPTCYHAEMNEMEDEHQLWMEHIEGVCGLDLTGAMYERAAEELGRFQGRLYAQQPAFLRELANLSGVGFVRDSYQRYRSWNVVYDYIRSETCGIPRHLCGMLTGIDKNAEEILRRIEALPVVLCHRDFWVAIIFHTDGGIVLIDWDTSGWGSLGEDLASLIADEADVEHMVAYYQRCVPAYYRGFSAHAQTPPLSEHCVYELMLILFGYRLVEWYLYAETEEERELQIRTLQRIYEIGESASSKRGSSI